MAYIYKIINDINDKIYIGLTFRTIQNRFKQHISDSKKNTDKHRPLYNAMKKYGAEHFSVIEIEQCDDSEANARESYWIQYYNTYKKGYNATLGGEGKPLYSYEEIINDFKNTDLSARELANKYQCSVDTILNIIHTYYPNIDWEKRYKNRSFNRENNLLLAAPKKVMCVEENIIFESTLAAEKWLIENKKTTAKKSRTHISAVCKGRRKHAYGYTWKYV